MTGTATLSGRALDGRYELHGLIGKGTFGRVYRGRDQRLGRPVAVKVIKPWWTEDPEWAGRFEREAQLMARINHPGIVQIFDIGYAEEGLYYVAELVAGESLADRLRRGPLPAHQALDVAEQLCRALAEAHAQRVVHRDVKPANVLIDCDGRVKVGDFGIARLAEGGTEGPSGTIVGTPRYMAPEQARGGPTTPATDVYGAGIVLYEMLAGRPPFTESSAVELALRHLSDPPPPLPSGTPSAAVEVVEQALAKDPAARYPTGLQMADALRRAGASLRDAEHSRDADATAETASMARAPKLAATLVAARLSPRRIFGPAESRQYRALLALVLVILLALVAGAALTANGSVRVPVLHGLSSAGIVAKLRALHLHAAFIARHDQAPSGTEIAQNPAPGARVDEGSAVRVVLSTGPPPVTVPQLVGQRLPDARAILQGTGLEARVTQVAAPGATPGIVVRQTPAAAASLSPHSTVALSVVEAPRWRPLTSFAGDGGGRSLPLQIRGTSWRVVYRMGYDGTCTLLFICSGPSTQVTNLNTGSRVAQFDLGEGSGQTHGFRFGPGLYRIAVTPGSDTAHWSIEVQDYY